MIRHAIATLLLLIALPLRADSLHIAVASNFFPTLEALLPSFRAQYPHDIIVSSAASGVLFQQIMSGAPFNVFLSADALRPEQLERAGRIRPGSRRTYAMGELVIASRDAAALPTANHADALRQYLAGRPPRSIAIAEPATAPYGLAAQQVYDSVNLWSATAPSRVTANNVSQVATLIATGSVSAGFICRAQLHTLDWHWMALPDDSYTPVQQQVVILAGTTRVAAEQFATFLQSDAARSVIREHGYRLP